MYQVSLYFCFRIARHTKYSHSISIEGYAGEAELLSSSAGAPGANQVRFNQSGLLEFSSDDAGKSVTGTYLWIQHENY